VAAQLAKVTAIPFLASDADWVNVPFVQVTKHAGHPLTASGKPEVLYIGTEYCPYCAAENWALLVALGRFGTFTGVNEIRSARYPPIPPLDSWTFYGSAFSSRYLTFVPVERYSNVLVSPRANPLKATSYRRLQKLTPAQRALMNEVDKAHGTPFIDFGGRAVMTGSPVLPQTLEQLTWSQWSPPVADTVWGIGSGGGAAKPCSRGRAKPLKSALLTTQFGWPNFAGVNR
jgi:uncharacterized protein DUF929